MVVAIVTGVQFGYASLHPCLNSIAPTGLEKPPSLSAPKVQAAREPQVNQTPGECLVRGTKPGDTTPPPLSVPRRGTITRFTLPPSKSWSALTGLPTGVFASSPQPDVPRHVPTVIGSDCAIQCGDVTCHVRNRSTLKNSLAMRAVSRTPHVASLHWPACGAPQWVEQKPCARGSPLATSCKVVTTPSEIVLLAQGSHGQFYWGLLSGRPPGATATPTPNCRDVPRHVRNRSTLKND